MPIIRLKRATLEALFPLSVKGMKMPAMTLHGGMLSGSMRHNAPPPEQITFEGWLEGTRDMGDGTFEFNMQEQLFLRLKQVQRKNETFDQTVIRAVNFLKNQS